MTDLKSFHISDIVSISSGILVSTRHMEGIYDILSHMAGTELFTHQLPSVCRQAEPVLKEAHPFLNEIVVPTITTAEECEAFVNEIVEKYGEFFAVAPLETTDIPTFAEAVALAKSNRDG